MSTKFFQKCSPLFFLLFFSASVLGEQFKNLKILQSDSRGVLFEFSISGFKLNKAKLDDKVFTTIEISGLHFTDEAGKPRLPNKSVILGIPTEGNVTLQILQTEIDSHLSIGTEPVLPARPPEIRTINFDETLYRQNIFFPGEIIKIREIAWIREHRVAILNIAPVQYNPGRGELLVYKKIIAKLNFQKEGVRGVFEPEGAFDKILPAVILNYQISRDWTKKRERDKSILSRLPNTSPLYKILIESDGIYRITGNDLISAEIDISGINPQTLKIYNRGKEVPIYFSNPTNSTFSPGDYFEFYGERNRDTTTHSYRSPLTSFSWKLYYDRYSDVNVYWLCWGGNPGMRLVEEDGNPSSLEAIELTSFDCVAHAEKDSFFWRLKPDGGTGDQNDPYFWDDVDGTAVGSNPQVTVNRSYPLFIYDPDTTSSESTRVRVLIHGRKPTPPDSSRTTVLYLNNYFWDNTTWDGQVPFYREKIGPPNKDLVNGQNLLHLTFTGYPGKGVVFNWFEVEYKRLFRANDDFLEFTPPKGLPNGLYKFCIKGFRTSDIIIYKLGVSKIINGEVRFLTSENSWKVVFQDEILSPETRYVIFTSGKVKKPKEIVFDQPSNLTSSNNQADYIIVTADEFYDGAVQLANYRQAKGFKTAVVRTSDIYDEFNDGISGAPAIKNFLKFAYANWAPPRFSYVLLLGDGSWDYKGNLKGFKSSYLPVYLEPINYYGLVSSDNYFACLSGTDIYPDVFVGRLPISSQSEFQSIFQKIQEYEDRSELSEWKRRVLFIAGLDAAPPMVNSHSASDYLAKQIPNFCDAVKVYNRHQGRQDLINAFDEGAIIAGYYGHGGGDTWSHSSFFVTDDIPRLDNFKRLPFIGSFTCLSGYVEEPNSHSMGEIFVLIPGRGAIGFFGSTATSESGSADTTSTDCPFYPSMMKAFFEDTIQMSGELSTIPKLLEPGKIDMIKSYCLIGDPGVRIVFPQLEGLNLTANPSSLSPGDTISVIGKIPAAAGGQALLTIYDTQSVPFKKTAVAVPSDSFVAQFVIPDSTLPGEGKISCYATLGDKDWLGGTSYAVENPYISNIRTVPSEPTTFDSVYIQAKIFDQQRLDSIYCFWWTIDSTTAQNISMNIMGGDSFKTITPIPPQNRGVSVYFFIVAIDSLNNRTTSLKKSYKIPTLPDLAQSSSYPLFLEGKEKVSIKAQLCNQGDSSVFNVPVSFSFVVADTDTIFFGRDTVNFNAHDTVTAEAYWNEKNQFQGGYLFRILIDPDSLIPESNKDNNIITQWLVLDKFNVSTDSGTYCRIQDVDKVLDCYIPGGAISKPTVLSFRPNLTPPVPLYQPDVSFAVPQNSHQISLADSTIRFLANKKMNLKLFYNSQDSTNQAEKEHLAIYCWQPDFQKWSFLGGRVDSNFVELESPRVGFFSILINRDDVSPKIEPRIEGDCWDWVNHIYNSENAKLSAIFSDADGIEVNEQPLSVSINGETVPTNEYTYTATPTNMTNTVSLLCLRKFAEGDYTAVFSASDVNGNQATQKFSFKISTEFVLKHIGNYPNPVTKDETRFVCQFSKPPQTVTLKIFTISGRLIRVLQGTNQLYQEIPWDLRDSKGDIMANGVYFYRLVAVGEDGKKVETTMKLAILR
ncbi:MAG: C25 family cysteine peptidase [Candidatus Edwardsbacteria bacterium]